MKEIIKHPILPRELKQEHKTCLIVLKVLKVAHETFTWSGRKYHIVGRYGGHKWHGFSAQGLDAREAFPLSIEFRLVRLFEVNTGYQLVQQDVHENKLQAF